MSFQFKKRSKISQQNLRKKDESGGDWIEEQILKAEEINENSGAPKGKSDATESVVVTPATTTNITAIYESSREKTPQSYAGDATYTSEIDTAIDRDARAVLERNIRLQEEGNEIEGIYRGQAGYKNFIKKDMAQVGSNKYTGTHGPILAPSFVRSTARFDYQPDICKDYKETGFCGYGDQCKFLHDRGDYKSGWQLEREWDAEQSRKRKLLEDSIKQLDHLSQDDTNTPQEIKEGEQDETEVNYEVEVEDAELPFACFVCREIFQSPIVTLCGHYFCNECALSFYRKSPKCPICAKQTFGVFNIAHKLIKKLKATSATLSASNNNITESVSKTSSSSSSSSSSSGNKIPVAPPKRGQWETVS